jgi:hypothetical protein
MASLNRSAQIRVTDSSRRYDWTRVFLVVLFLISLPSKFIFYSAGLAIVAYSILLGKPLDSRHYVTLMLFATVGVLSLAFEVESGTVVLSAILWFVTYGTFLVLGALLVFPPRRAPGFNDYRLVAQILSFWVLIQGATGIVQFAISGNGDAVAGTVGLLDFQDSITINQVYFGFSVLSLLPFIALFPGKIRFRWLSVFTGALAVILSQSGHATLFFLLAIFVFFTKPRYWTRILIAAIFVLTTLYGVQIVYPRTFDIVASWFEKTFGRDSPKLLMIEKLTKEATEDPKFGILGAGPGQYLSRAMLIGSGLLTRVELPGMEIPPRVDEEYWMIWSFYEQVGEGSAIAKPYNSFMSVFAEWGLVGLGTVLLGFIVIVSRALRIVLTTMHPETLFAGQYILFYVTFLLLAAGVELYFEMPAAIAPGALVAALAQARALGIESALRRARWSGQE